ncbi:MAG: hypothetical protein JW797_00430 [Bradymonadales bacterium]|nr:hypothetical protein [Bradymonadales bacterium]
MAPDHSDSSSNDLDTASSRGLFRRGPTAVLGAVLLLAGLAALPWAIGWWCDEGKSFQYDRVDLIIANQSRQPVEIQIDRKGPTRIGGGRVQSIPFRAGEVRLQVRAEDGSMIEDLRFFTDNQPVFYNGPQPACYAVMDLSGWYGDRQASFPIRVVERIYPRDRLVLIPEGVMVKPGHTAPRQARPGTAVLWIEAVACELLSPENEHLLIGQQSIIMQGRWERLERPR